MDPTENENFNNFLQRSVEAYNNSFSRAISTTPNRLYVIDLHIRMDEKYKLDAQVVLSKEKARAMK